MSLGEKSLLGNKNSIEHQEALSDEQGNGNKREVSKIVFFLWRES